MVNESVLQMLIAYMAAMSMVGLIVCVIQIIAWWKIFTKAGEAGWKSIIPFYSQYTQFKIAWKSSMFFVILVLLIASSILGAFGTIGALLSVIASIACLVLVIMFNNKLAKAFGKGAGFTVGLILFNFIFVLILAFGSAEYQGADQ